MIFVMQVADKKIKKYEAEYRNRKHQQPEEDQLDWYNVGISYYPLLCDNVIHYLFSYCFCFICWQSQ